MGAFLGLCTITILVVAIPLSIGGTVFTVSILTLILMCPLAFAGMAFGISGMIKTKRQRSSIAGLILNALYILCVVALFALLLDLASDF